MQYLGALGRIGLVIINQCKYLLMPGYWSRHWLHFNLLLFTVVNGKGPPRVLIWRLKNSFYSTDKSHSPREGCLTSMGLLWMLPSVSEQSRSCREQPVLFLFYRSGGLGCKPSNLHLSCLVLKMLKLQTSSLLEEHDILECKLVTGIRPDSLETF